MRSQRIEPAAPYSLERTVGAFARFPEESVDIVVPVGYRRAFDSQEGPVLIEARQDDDPYCAGILTLRVLGPAPVSTSAVESAMQSMRAVIAADERIDDVEELMGSDSRISVLRSHLTGLRRTLDPDPFEGLVSSILAQLISIRGAAVVRSRLVKRFGRSLKFEEERYWTFPRPDVVVGSSVDELCGLGMTSAKARAILAVANAAVCGELLPEQLRRHSDREIISHLTALPGIGPWTAQWFLINVLARMSVVPVDDLGIRRSTGKWLGDGEMPSPDDVRSIYEPFGERRAYVAYYVLSAERYAIPPVT